MRLRSGRQPNPVSFFIFFSFFETGSTNTVLVRWIRDLPMARTRTLLTAGALPSTYTVLFTQYRKTHIFHPSLSYSYVRINIWLCSVTHKRNRKLLLTDPSERLCGSDHFPFNLYSSMDFNYLPLSILFRYHRTPPRCLGSLASI